MNEITLKVTRVYELPDNFVKLHLKDTDDNLPLRVIQNKGPTYDVIHVIDNNADFTNYFICRIQGVESPMKDMDWNVTPLTISYSHKGD